METNKMINRKQILTIRLRTPPFLTRKWDNLADWMAIELLWSPACQHLNLNLWRVQPWLAGRVGRESWGGCMWNYRVLSVGKCWCVDLTWLPPWWWWGIVGRKEGRYKVGQTAAQSQQIRKKDNQLHAWESLEKHEKILLVIIFGLVDQFIGSLPRSA